MRSNFYKNTKHFAERQEKSMKQRQVKQNKVLLRRSSDLRTFISRYTSIQKRT